MDATSEASFAEFVRTQWRDLVRAAIFLGAGPDEAEDLAQQTLVRCYSSWQRVTDAANRDAYVYRMLLNQLRDVRRTRWWRSRVDIEPDGHVEDVSGDVVTSDAIHHALAALTKAQRDVVVLRYFVQLTEAQTAAALGIPAGTVKSRLSRALAILAGSHHLSELSEEHR
ncbi:SigE family RNA polymerase sigma factor [Aeromicrobium sp. NPDC092404]|uniref:SigE family RNA polymerase sigma factor n=1 Tax=Aeromicrobium sp. NPDC092404 TaxID=3154976 RepID=UPI0034204027